jgi:hypothetical protein
MRVYVPLTIARLRAANSRPGVLAPSGLVFAVTDELRAEYPGADDEELEYLAMSDAARASLRLLAGESEPDWLRVVAAADVDNARSEPDLDRAIARVSEEIPWKRIASVHVDGADAAPLVRAAADVIDAADLGDLDAEFTVGNAEDIDLAWWSPNEVRFLLEDLDQQD